MSNAPNFEDDYEEIAQALKDYKIVDDGIWLSWNDLWRIDAVACRNGGRAIKAVENGHEYGNVMFQAYVGQRMLIEDIAELVRPKTETEE